MEEVACPPTPPLSTCPATPPGSHSPKSSPSEWKEQQLNKTETPPSPSGSRPSSPENCAICLGSLTNKSFTNSCLHQFCFVCLLEWSKVKAECPLCKVAFNSIIHNVRSQDDYDQYHVKQTPRATSIWSSLPFSRNFRYRTTVTYHEFSHWVAHRTYPQVSSAVSIHEAIPSRHLPSTTFTTRPRNTAGTSDFRRSVYNQDLWARLQPDVTGRYRECSPEFYRQNPAQLHRLIPFLNRELNVLLENGSRTAYVMERILELLPQFSMTSSEFRVRVGSFIGSQHSAHFCHELRAYASSPYDIVGYDRSVQYHPSAASNFADEVNDITSPSVSNHSTHDSDSESDIQIIEPASVPSSAPTSRPRAVASVALQPEDESYSPLSPQPGPSGLSTRFTNQPGVHTALTSSVVEVTSGSSSEDEPNDVQIVGYVKPRHERTPEIITLSSPDHTSAVENDGTPHFDVDAAHDSSDDLICINLGGNSSVSHHLSWNGQYDDFSSDEGFLATRPSRVESSKNKRRTRAADCDSSSQSWLSSPSRNSSGEEWTCRSKRKGASKSVKKRKLTDVSLKSRSSKFDDSSESENEAKSSSALKKTRKRSHSRPSKSNMKCSKSGAGHHSSHRQFKKKRSDDHCVSSNSKRKDRTSDGDTEASTSRGKLKGSKEHSHTSTRLKKYFSSDHNESHRSSSHSASGSSSRFRNPKLQSIVMTRTTSHEGEELWSVSRNESSPERFHSKSENHRTSRVHSVVNLKSPTSHSPQSERLSDLSPSNSNRNRHRHSSSSSSSSNRRENSKTATCARDYKTDKCKNKRKKRCRLGFRDGHSSKDMKWNARKSSERDSDSY